MPIWPEFSITSGERNPGKVFVIIGLICFPLLLKKTSYMRTIIIRFKDNNKIIIPVQYSTNEEKEKVQNFMKEIQKMN